MSHSTKHFPAGTWCCCKSQHRGKKKASRRFRRKAKILIRQKDSTTHKQTFSDAEHTKYTTILHYGG